MDCPSTDLSLFILLLPSDLWVTATVGNTSRFKNDKGIICSKDCAFYFFSNLRNNQMQVFHWTVIRMRML